MYEVVFLEKNMHVLKRIVIACHGHVIQRKFFHSEIWKILLVKGHGNFATTVCSEVEADDNISFFNGLVIPFNLNGFNKFVGNAIHVGLRNS